MTPKKKSAPEAELRSAPPPPAVRAFLRELDQPHPPVQPQNRAGRKVPVQLENADTPSAPAKPDLQKVFSGSGGDQPPPTNMRSMQRSSGRQFHWGWAIGGLAVLTAATLAGFFVFNRAQRFSGDRVQLQIDAPAEAASGSSVSFDLKYQNLEPVDLVMAELVLEYPEGFTIEETSQPASNEFQNAFELGTLKSGRAGTLTVSGTLFGSVGSDRRLVATLTFRAENFSSDFQTTAEATVKITSSILELKLEGPTKLTPGASGTWTISYSNTAARDLTDVQIEVFYPDGLTPTAVDPAAIERSALWRFDTVTQGEQGKITVTATASGDSGDSLELVVRAGLVGATNTVDLQAEQKLLIVLIPSGVRAAVAVNGQTENATIEPGENLQYSLRVTNDGEIELNDLTVKVALTGDAMDFEKLENPSKAEVEEQTLTWTKDQVLSLELLKPGQEATLRFTVGSQATLTVDGDEDLRPEIVANVTVTSPALPAVEDQPVTATFSTKVVTVFRFKAEARYADDQGLSLGSGPIPPKVGQTTAYRIFWRVTNTTSDATDMIISAELPTGVFWTGKNISRDAGDISFDAATRTVRWSLNKVPAGTGSRLPQLVASFEVSITPTSDQVGASVVLVQTATATATDSFTARELEVTQPSVTTDVPNDPVAGGEGEVQA